jgi:hypothetical protein
MPGTIKLKYIEGMIPEAELDLFRSRFGELEMGFECIDISREPRASLEEYLPL